MAQGIHDGIFNARMLVSASLERAEQVQSKLNAFTIIDHGGALAAADRIDAERAIGKALPALAGVPIVIKDMTPTSGLPTTLGSCATKSGSEAEEDAIIVSRLRLSGAIIVAKSTTSELAYSGFTRSLRYGVTRNPWNVDRTTGGSSGGSAVAVAAGVVPFAEGSDMGGSIRIPAAACGIVGFKPSLGRIPMTILPTPIDTMSHFGPLAARVSDAVAFVAATSGPSDLDLLSQVTSFDVPACKPTVLRDLHFGFSVDLGYCSVAQDVRESFMESLDRLRANGARVTEVSLTWTRDVMDQWLVKWAALLSLFPATQQAESRALMDPQLVSLLGSAEHQTAGDLKRTEILQSKMAADFADIMGRFDAFLCPTLAVTAPGVMAQDVDYEVTLPNGSFQCFDMAHPFSMLATYPAISLPIMSNSDDLPIGLQIVGPRYRDERLLSIAGAVEKCLGEARIVRHGWQN